MPEYLASITLGQVLNLAVVLGGFVVLIRKAGPPLARLTRLLDDLMGEQARPGFDRRPGVLERMQLLETAFGRLTEAQTRLANAQEQISTELRDLAREVRSTHQPVTVVTTAPSPPAPSPPAPAPPAPPPEVS